MFEIGKMLGLTQDESQHITDYLEGEGLIEYHTIGGGILITHYGIVQVEEALSHPEKPTQYFPPINIIQVGQMFQSQVQQASEGGQQTLTITGAATSEIHALLAELKSAIGSMKLDLQTQKDLAGEITTIEGQMQTSKPKKSIIKESLTSLRTILEQSGAALLAAKVLPLISGLG